MKYYPTEIAHKTFDRKMMGYDHEQVTNFLQLIASQLETIIQEKKTLSDELRNKELDLIALREKEGILNNAITQTTQMTDKIKEEAEREARIIIHDAQQKAEMILRDSKETLRKMYQEIADLKKSKMQFEANLRAMAQAHLALLEQSEPLMPRTRLSQYDFDLE